MAEQESITDFPVHSEPASSQDAGHWYILHTYSGFEQRVEQMIRELMRTGQDKGCIHDVVVPTERVIELGKGGQKRTTTRKFYPGYVMVRMTMTDLSWHLVQNIPKVTGFVGGKNRPAPMGPGEAERILSLMETRQEQPRPKFTIAATRSGSLTARSAVSMALWKRSTTTRASSRCPCPFSAARRRWSSISSR